MGDLVDVAEASQCPPELIEIHIKRLRSETYTLRVDRSVRLLFLNLFIAISIVELKERIADLSGVISGLQHLLFRGRVLNNDHQLSDYLQDVEGGHTLYMVVIPPIPQLSRSPSSNAAVVRTAREASVYGCDHASLIPDALSLVSAYLNHLRREFAANCNNSQTSGNSMGNEQECGPTRENQIPTQSLLDRVVQTRRQLLIGEMAQCLSNISMVLEDRLNRRDSSSQILRQERATESETRLSIVGNSLIQLGQNISRIGMGERPVCTSLISI
ncbi:hypothetical protein EUTSA_v10016005mg [Eutrema salsugineum]|uniref:Ubiquitin-like domain-containing protein n=1 Tax=Eutrema salsugineum TaxID=72664 RepID=V4N688_EUTSA|nr:hypothetical protein EUTSA_v10016005mg [Eutrema salsugineum]